MSTVLVVEDSPTQAHALAELLEAAGYDVEIAPDGSSGFRQCKELAIDVVLSDIVMPDIDGYELCRRLKSDPSTNSIPVILLTSLADPMDIVRGLECGADNFIPKPYDASNLLSHVRRLLENKLLRGQRKLSVGVDVLIMGKKFTINSEKEQMLDLLISTFEEVLRSRQREYEVKLREDTMRESHRFLQSVLDALSAEVIIVDDQGKIVAANAPWRRFLESAGGAWPNAGVGGSYLEIWNAVFAPGTDDRARIINAVRAVHSGATSSFATEYAATLLDQPRWFRLSAIGFKDPTGRLVSIEHEDITARKQLEQQFYHSQKMEAIGQLAGGVAHDFNNLLTVIGCYTDFLLQSLAPDDARRLDAAQIQKAAETASALTRQLLAFSRKQVLHPKVIDVNAVITSVDDMLRRLIGTSIDYATVLDPAVDPIRADPNQLHQILMNLVVNARDAMPKGGKLIVETTNAVLDESYVASHPGVKPGHYVLLAVSDNGLGMDEQTQARIFEPFFTTKDVGSGTGLGLSTVCGIVQQNEGHIWVYSKLGHGTTFKIYLPRADSSADEELADAQSRTLRTHTASILVVDANETVRLTLSRILRVAGYTVLEAAGPEEALTAARDAQIDLLIADLVMPGLNGAELAAELMATRPCLSAILMSGYSGTAMARPGEPGAGTSLLEKPFTPESVMLKVHEALARRPESLPPDPPDGR